jgi:hypothetical protein
VVVERELNAIELDGRVLLDLVRSTDPAQASPEPAALLRW